MKRCPKCSRIYSDDTLNFCLDDGEWLVAADMSTEPTTAVLSGDRVSEAPTREQAIASDPEPPATSAGSNTTISSKGIKPVYRVGIGLLLMAGLGFGLYRYVGGRHPQKQISFESAKLTRLTTTGKATHAAISPDGKYVVHVQDDSGQQSLWIRQIPTQSNVQIVTPSHAQYSCITFSPDGNYIYFARKDEASALRTLYQTPVLGGATRKVMEDVGETVAVSPDGTQFAFVRLDRAQGESSLVVASVDGSSARKLATQKEPAGFSRDSPAWSPDGKVIACSISRSGSGEEPSRQAPFSVIEVSVADGEMRTISSQRWGAIEQLAWLRDSSGLLFSAADQSSGYFFQIWYVARGTGDAQRVTNDLNNYSGASLTADSSALVTVEADVASNIWVAPEGDANRARQITSAKYDGNMGVALASDGRIVHATRTFDVWVMDADGGNARPLTDDHTNRFVSISPDSRYIVFESWRSGSGKKSGTQVWRIDVDGGNAKSLTSGEGSKTQPQISPDGKWVVYQSNKSGKITLWRVPLDGGEEQQLTQEFSRVPAVSPDAQWIACVYQHDLEQPFKLAIIPAQGGQPVKEFEIPQDVALRRNIELRFSSDGRAIDYVNNVGGVSNLWRQPVEGGSAKQLTDFKSGLIFAFDWSKDGKQLVLARGTVTRDAVLIKDFLQTQ